MDDTYLQIDLVKLGKQLPVEQIPARDIIVRWELFAYQPRVHLVHQQQHPLGDLSHRLGRMVNAGAAGLRERSAGEPALLVVRDALAQDELLQHLHAAQR